MDRICFRKTRVVEPAHIAKFSVTIEDEDMRSAEAAIRFGGFLGVAVVEIRERESLLSGVALHVLETVAILGIAKFGDGHCIGVIGTDGYGRQAARFKFFCERDQARFDGVRSRTMIGKKDD